MCYLNASLCDYSCAHECVAVCCSVLQCVAVSCSVLQCAVVCCSVLQCVAVSCNVLQCVAVCCSVLQCVAVSGCLHLLLQASTKEVQNMRDMTRSCSVV